MKRFISVLALALLAVGCSLPTDDSAQVIPEAELAPSLQKVPTTTTAPPPEFQTRDFAYFLLEQKPETEQRVVRQVVVPIPVGSGSLFDAIEPMEIDGFKETIGADAALINTVNQYDIVAVEINDDIATVFLESLGSEPPNVPVLRDVAAQLVWTLTGDGQVDGVLFNVDGAPQSIPTSAESVDRPVDIDDYATYNEQNTGTTTTLPTGSTTTTTTVPPDDSVPPTTTS
ncbi:MAG: GerMN domain-containing protein [Acidimicrobiales bacterium]